MPSGVYKRTKYHREISRRGGIANAKLHPRKPDVELICLKCGIQFTVEYKRRHYKYCSLSHSISDRHPWNYGRKLHYDVWNKGLTKETSEIVKYVADKKIGIQRPDMLGLNNSNFRNAKKYNGYGKHGEFFSKKNQKSFFYRSSYELIAMKIFEQLSTIKRYDYETLSLPYIDKMGKKHTVTPDFIVEYTNGIKEIIEVKPQYMIDKDLQNTRLKIETMKNFAKNNNYNFSIWTEKDIQK